MDSICNGCGLTFKLKLTQAGTPFPNKWNVCSSKCQQRAKRQADGLPTRKWIEPCICKNCKRVYKPKASDRTTYCSRDCYFNYRRDNPRKPETPPFSNLVFNSCSICNKKWTAPWFKGECSSECVSVKAKNYQRDRYLQKYEVRQFQCKQCQTSVTTRYKSTRRLFCSTKCVKKYSHRDKPSNNYRRAKKLGQPSEKFDELLVLERDGWRCQLCGIATPQKFRGTHYPNAPEIDHIIPISKGGGHTWTNVQCACRQCNSNKGSKLLGQLILFGEHDRQGHRVQAKSDPRSHRTALD